MPERPSAHTDSSTPVWDLPLRLFHWTLVLLIIVSVVSVNIGGNAMEIHAWSGITLLTLILFRIVWGFAGGHHARFAHFVRGPAAIVAYVRGLRSGQPAHPLGHNPLGALSVLALLGCLLLQAITGLFSNDDIMMEGPLVKWISKDLSDTLTGIHHINSKVLLALVVLHLTAIAYHTAVLKEKLVGAMFSGRKPVAATAAPEPAPARLVLRGAVVLALCAGAVYLLLR